MPTVIALSTPGDALLKARAPYDKTGSELFLSLAVCDELWVDDVADVASSIAGDFSPLNVWVHGIGTFQGEHLALYAAVLLTPELWELHAELHHKLERVGTSRPNYTPGRWVPHITLATVSTPAKAATVYSELIATPLTGEYHADEIVLVSGPPPTVEERFAFKRKV